jgi:hypothetical protein
LGDYPQLGAWIERVRQQPGFLETTYSYDIDPQSRRELP